MKNKSYITKFIKRKNKLRKITTYNDDSLREQHLKIKEILDKELKYSIFTKAYIKKSSIFENAKSHLYNDIFIKVDIKDFFNSINHRLLSNFLFYEMNRKKKEKYSKDGIDWLISYCTTTKYKGVPLGLITSPALANIFLKEFDNILYGKLKKYKLENIIYTRYADDLTISFKNYDGDINKLNNEIVELIKDLLKRYKLELNVKKIQFINLKFSNHVRITGVNITVDDKNFRKLSIGRKKINNLYYRSINLQNKLLKQNFIYTNEDLIEAKSIKGMESFILSINKKGYGNIFSDNMVNEINKLGFNTLSDLIKSFNSKEK